jgi:nickel-type superoxide dismutase maturation protease
MLPALRPGDWVIVEAAARRSRPFRPGDVVLVPDPRDTRRVLVKRLVRLTAAGDAWVEGDNPAESTDSRQFGEVRAADIVGRAVFRYHPLSRFGRVR